MDAIKAAQKFSDEKIEALRQSLKDLVPAPYVVVTCGSFARREADTESDLDYFLITPDGDTTPPDWLDELRSRILAQVTCEPSKDGAFKEIQSREAMLKNIGGEKDNNGKLTRRMLLLLEGEWLTNESGLASLRREIIERYVNDKITDHQLALFLLNDIIRYYRTIAVDYEFKTIEAKKPKPWGIRNIKLVFSRKLLYASGLFCIGMTADKTAKTKQKTLEELLSIPVIDRMGRICGDAEMKGVLEYYNNFLASMSDRAVRVELKSLDREKQRDSEVFRMLKNDGHLFTRELLKLFERTFDPTHPIRRAVMF